MQVLINEGAKPIKAWIDGVPIEDAAKVQLENIARMPFVHSHMAVMPDVHLGIGATVGSVIPTLGAIIPAAVGVDIGCVDAETEYMSPQGWRKIKDYDGELVLCYCPQKKTSRFVKPAAYIRKPSGGFHHFKTKYGVDQMVSGDHKMLVYAGGRYDRYEEFRTPTAEEFASKHNSLKLGCTHRIKTCPENYDSETSVPYSEWEIRVIVMTAADCSLSGQVATLRVKKYRKYLRAKEILAKAGVEVSADHKNGELYTVKFKAVSTQKSLTQFYSASVEQLRIISDEVLFWDGSEKANVFYTAKEEEADFVHWAFTLSGYRAVKRIDARAAVKEGQLKSWVDYRVFRHTNTLVGVNGSPKTPVSFSPSSDGLEYCFTVETGFFIVRRNGVTAITGNCGMVAARTNLRAEDLPDSLAALRTAWEAAIPHGRTDNGGANDRGAWGSVSAPNMDLWLANMASDAHFITHVLDENPKLDSAFKRAPHHLGTLGSGNHFVEGCLDTEGVFWVMLHSGSRGVGNRIGQIFIEKAKQDMRTWFVNLPDADLAYLPEGTENFRQYVLAVEWAQRFAALNRRVMLDAAMQALRATLGRQVEIVGTAVNCHHNYVAKERHFGQNVWLTRKGAVSAKEGELGIIPGSMGAKSFIVRGKGNRESFCSCSHGAGRKMSRNEAKKVFTLADHEAATAGVECRKDASVLDETPGAYKDIDAVMAAQADLVEIVHTLKQVVCVKG